MSALDRLAERSGIEPSLEDALGQEHVTAPEIKRALLEALGVRAADDQQATAALEQMDAQEWARQLPPVMVVYTGSGPIEVPVVLDAGTERMQWTLTLEDGTVKSGEVRAGELNLLASGERDGKAVERRGLRLAEELPWGYHRFALGSGSEEMSLILTPGRCWLPAAEGGEEKFWGIAAPLYLLRSARNWGMGDFSDLRELVEFAGQSGASILGLNPLHAMFLDQPESASPYSPSDRLLLNVLYIDVLQVPEMEGSEEAQRLISSPEFQSRLASSREAKLVQYKSVAELKLAVLRLLFAAFEMNPDPERVRAFEAFHEERRELLDRACTFQAMRAYFAAHKPDAADCSEWPEDLRNSQAPGVQRFAEKHGALVRFHLWMQWVADEQLREAHAATQGMAIGLYRDLAVGAAPSGAEVWSEPETLVSSLQIGAPPDIWNPAGQNWGLPPMHPQRMREQGYRGFIQLLRANMRYAGALRIDHVMALKHLYLIPKGGEPKEGAYVRYPMEDLIGVLALESHRNRCMVVGEDLGTVPRGFRERMEQAAVLSYRLLFFERDDNAFTPPEEYPRLALAMASSHDLPTLEGWWNAADLQLKEQHQLFPTPEKATGARSQRSKDRDDIVSALRRAGVLDRSDELTADEFRSAAHRFLARTESMVTMLQLDDLTGEKDQVNLPGAPGDHPNWRRKISMTLEDLSRDQGVTRTLEEVRQQVMEPALANGNR